MQAEVAAAVRQTVFASYILPRLESGEWKRILFVPTGALLSKVSFMKGKVFRDRAWCCAGTLEA